MLVVVLSLSALVGWGYQRYVGLVQRQVEIADASARLDASNRTRLQLVANLLHGSAGKLTPGVSVAELEKAHDLVAGVGVGPDMDSDGYDRFCSAQEDLSGALDAFWPAAVADVDSDTRTELADLKEKLDRSAAVLQARIDDFDRCVDTYADEIGQFPGSLIAALAGGDLQAGPAVIHD